MRRAAAAAAFACSLHATSTYACAPAPRQGETVAIAAEEAVIVWDAAKKVEHFIRRAKFATESKDFGFLVPTPTKPTLAEAPDGVFDSAIQPTLPRVEVHHERSAYPSCSCMMFLFGRSATRSAPAPQEEAVAAAAPVRVLETATVAGFDATVLEADDAGALAKWLGDHGYDNRPSLKEWLAPYVANKWKLTAFRIADARVAGPAVDVPAAIGTKAVLMSFATEKPFFPYREPADQREGPAAAASRLLRVFFVTNDGRVGGTVGANGAWPGTLTYSKPLAAIPAGLDPALVPAGAWLSRFEDTSSPRPGTDELYFAKAASQAEVEPPPIVTVVREDVPIPVDLVALALAGGVGTLLWQRRRRTKRA